MKLSNKILLGFFGFVFLYLTAAFAEIRLTGTPNIINDKNSIAETVDMPGIAYVVLNDLDRNVKITVSDRPRLEVRSLSGDLLKNLKYTISGDTLILSDFQSEDTRRVSITVLVPETSFKGITVNNSTASVQGLQQEFLQISQNDGRIWMSDNRIAKIQMDVLHDSHLNISSSNLDTLSANIDRSEVLVLSPVTVLQGSLKNDAFLRVTDVREIQLKKDEGSRLNLYQ